MRFFCAAVTLFALTLLLPTDACAQTYSYKTFDLTNGLPGSYVNAIGQDNEGFLWVGLETGLYRFDGFIFYSVSLPDTLSQGYPSSLFCDEEGVMWIGFTDGSLFTWSAGSVVTRQGNTDADRINRIMAAPDGKTWIISQSRGIYVAGGGKTTKLATPEGIVIFDIAFVG
ncbi:MAG TPA: two-component regulator propeller domain-containing protein [Bacteroidales bacterium]|nr:two-component regulator propeller domain-containing protein [Bacteroidales bacterium]